MPKGKAEFLVDCVEWKLVPNALKKPVMENLSHIKRNLLGWCLQYARTGKLVLVWSVQYNTQFEINDGYRRHVTKAGKDSSTTVNVQLVSIDFDKVFIECEYSRFGYKIIVQ